MIFKKKKQLKEPVSSIAVEVDIPKVIRETKLKPTVCSHCGTIFQAEPRHLCFADGPFCAFTGSKKSSVICPICGAYNQAEFEVSEDGRD